MSEDTAIEVSSDTKLQITLRDNDTGAEVTSSVTITTANHSDARRQLTRAFWNTLDSLWPAGDDDGKEFGSRSGKD